MKIFFVNSQSRYSKAVVDLLELKFGQLPGEVNYCEYGDALMVALPENEPVIIVTEIAIPYAGETTLEGGAFRMIRDAKEKNRGVWAILYTISPRAVSDKDTSMFDCVIPATFDDNAKDVLYEEIARFTGISNLEKLKL